MRATFLGTNGWYASKSGNTVCTLLELPGCNVVLDAGDGFAKLDQFADLEKPTYIFLSHLHLDHVVGLHALGKFPFGKGVRLFCPKGTKRFLSKLAGHPFTMPFKDLPFSVEVRELAEGRHDFGKLRVEARKLVHSDTCFGYRFEIGGKTIAYCTDTGICENVYTLAENADLLICESAYLPGEAHAGWPHLNPESAAKIAAKTGAKKLALTHFDASRYTSLKQRKGAQTVARKVFPKTLSASDGMRIEI